MRLFISMCLVAAVSSAVPVRAQSLGDIAKKEEERRKETKSAPKTYTNRDLPASPAPPAPAPAAADPAAGGAAPAVAAPSRTMNADDPEPRDTDDPVAQAPTQASQPPRSAEPAARPAERPPDQDKERERWQGRMRALREQLERNKVLADALQSRLNSLDTDLISRDDPAQRAKLASERSRTAAELARLKKAVQADEKAIPDLEEEARRAGVPPGWLR